MDPDHPAADQVAGLEQTWQLIEGALARLRPADLAKLFPPLAQADRARYAQRAGPAL